MYYAEPNYGETVALEPWRQLLLDAADYIDRHGWCQYEYYASDGRVCAIGALRSVGTLMVRPEAEKALLNVVGAMSVGYWNDLEGRTQKDVVDAMRQAARA